MPFYGGQWVKSLQALPFFSVSCSYGASSCIMFVFNCLPELSSCGSSNWSHSLNVISNTLHINFLIPILFDRPDSLKHRTHCEIWGSHNGSEEDSSLLGHIYLMCTTRQCVTSLTPCKSFLPNLLFINV